MQALNIVFRACIIKIKLLFNLILLEKTIINSHNSIPQYHLNRINQSSQNHAKY